MASAGCNRTSFNQINVAPLADVLLVLVVIMILLVPGMQSGKLPINPLACHCREKARPRVDIVVAKNGMVSVNGQSVSANSLCLEQAIVREQAKAGTRDVTVSVSSDADALQRHVVAVLDAAEGAEVRHLILMPLRY